ncbi:hypothetical protein EST38_g7033 [Candolleomyces aberdarensis]|uniref:Uncharacterized protein n=1 Tax=Candolleomyces aberdarensis TaxID=2316362 RepID=A0A4Q2DI69_9AGAR|nr:hypothetical protein EST38_g7033 [Candolleomyces aberdarensis]
MESSQYSLFKDSVASQLFKDPEFKTAADELDEFASYLAAEAWPIVPERYQSATFEERNSVEDGVHSISLDAISPSFVDTLISYGQAEDTDDAVKFLRKALESYIEQATAPPPIWGSTRTKECEICERDVPLTYHHLIPKSTHAKVLKKGWHPESMLNKVAWLCRCVAARLYRPLRIK